MCKSMGMDSGRETRHGLSGKDVNVAAKYELQLLLYGVRKSLRVAATDAQSIGVCIFQCCPTNENAPLPILWPVQSVMQSFPSSIVPNYHQHSQLAPQAEQIQVALFAGNVARFRLAYAGHEICNSQHCLQCKSAACISRFQYILQNTVYSAT